MDARRWEALAEVGSSSAEEVVRLGRRFGTEVAQWAVEQANLRRRATGRFPLAERMLFVREALEQATHPVVAAYHASRFPPGVLVADLTTGIGSDLMELARRGPTRGYERDPDRAACARWNASLVGQAEVREEDCLTTTWDFEYALADPARRVEGRRTLAPEDFSPNPIELAERLALLRRGGIKLSPAMRDDFLERLGPEVEFVSHGGECREALVWTGSEVSAGRWAVLAGSGERLPSAPPPSRTDEPLAYLFDADPAVVRAHAVGSLRLPVLGDSLGYLTGPDCLPSPWLRSYRVLYHGKADTKATRRALRELGGRVAEVKIRGAKVDGPALQRELGGGGEPLSLVVWPVGKSLRHTLVRSEAGGSP